MTSRPSVSRPATTRDWVPFFDTVKTAGILGVGSQAASPGWRTAFLLHANGVKVYVISPDVPSRPPISCVSGFAEIREPVHLIACFAERGDLDEKEIREAATRRVPAFWLEPGVRLRPDTEALLEQAKARVVRGLSLYAEYLCSYACA